MLYALDQARIEGRFTRVACEVGRPAELAFEFHTDGGREFTSEFVALRGAQRAERSPSATWAGAEIVAHAKLCRM